MAATYISENDVRGPVPATMNGGDRVILSPDGRYQLNMQVDGNLVIYDAAGNPRWATYTNVPYSYLRVQPDGNVVIYDPEDDSPLWHTSTYSPGAVLQLQNDGNLVLYSPSGAALWDSAGFTGHAAVRVVARRSFTHLSSGQSLMSRSGAYRLTLGSNGNLAVTNSAGAVRWSSQTYSPGARLEAQADGNLVMYSSDGSPVWHAALYSPGASAVLQDDGNVVIYDRQGRPLWDTDGAMGRTAVVLKPERVFTRLSSGQSVTSWNQSFSLTMRTSGNLVLTNAAGSVVGPAGRRRQARGSKHSPTATSSSTQAATRPSAHEPLQPW